MFSTSSGPTRRWLLFALPLLALGAVLLTAGAAVAARESNRPVGQAEPEKPGGTFSILAHVPRTIPDQGVVTSTIVVTTVATISDVDVVNIVISHTFPGDLDVFLTSPSGTRVELFTDVCGGTDWDAANTGFRLSDGALARIGEECPPGNATYAPEGNLSAFNGQQTAGPWTLEIADDTAADGGRLDSWGLAFNAEALPAAPTLTPSRTATLIPTQTPVLAAERFTDVQPTDYFYDGVRFLVGQGAISGYDDAAHCGTAVPCFRPFSPVTRGQFAKIVVLGMDIPLIGSPPLLMQQPFSDVPQSDPFHLYIQTARSFGIVSGYSAAECGGTICFRPYNMITRGQLAKMVVEATGWDLVNPASPSFRDVPVGHAFYEYVETAACYGVIAGYADDTFRPQNSATRGQVSKMTYLGYTLTGADACGAVPTPLAKP